MSFLTASFYYCYLTVHNSTEDEPATLGSRPCRDPLGFLGTVEPDVIDLFSSLNSLAAMIYVAGFEMFLLL